MFSRMSITQSTGTYSDNIEKLKEALQSADAVVIGAGAGLSTSAGFVYNGERFQKYFSDFAAKYGFQDMTRRNVGCTFRPGSAARYETMQRIVDRTSLGQGEKCAHSFCVPA